MWKTTWATAGHRKLGKKQNRQATGHVLHPQQDAGLTGNDLEHSELAFLLISLQDSLGYGVPLTLGISPWALHGCKVSLSLGWRLFPFLSWLAPESLV